MDQKGLNVKSNCQLVVANLGGFCVVATFDFSC